MKCVVKTAAGSGKLALWDKPVPIPGDGEILVKVKAAAICGTDVHIRAWNEWSARRMGCDVVLTDISPEMLRFAEKNLADTGGKWHTLCGDWREISPDDPALCPKFDVAISTMDSITARDYPVIQGFVLWMAVIFVAISRAYLIGISLYCVRDASVISQTAFS